MNEPDSGHELRSPGFIAFLATQFFGAFNDNVFKLLISFFAIAIVGRSQADKTYVPLAGAMLTLPFLLFSPYAGQLADRFGKKRVMIWVKLAEIIIMSAGFVAFFSASCIGAEKTLPLLLGILFLMGAQSAFFSPAKYGFLPETLPTSLLSRGNGVLQMWTFLAIILGSAVSGQLSEFFAGRIHWAASFCVLIALIGFATSFGITPTAKGTAETHGFEANGLRTIITTIREMKTNPVLVSCLLGSCYFWFVGALFQLNVLLYAKKEMGASDSFVSILLATIALGIGIGSVGAGRLSGRRIDFRLVPLGAFGMGIFSCCLIFTTASPALALVSLAGLGFCAGFFNVPISAALQHHSPADRRGRYLAANNFLTFAAMTLAAFFLALVLRVPFVKPSHVFVLTGISAFASILLMFSLYPSFLSRMGMWLVPLPFFRIRITGAEQVPENGGVLLVCNHISFEDAPAVQCAIDRPIRFLIHKTYNGHWFLNFFTKRNRSIPIASEDKPKALIRSLRAATKALREGDVVCIFPEAMISRTGTLLAFRRGIEIITKGLDIPIIPMSLENLWGSCVGFRNNVPGGRGLRDRLGFPLRHPIGVHLGSSLPCSTPTWQIRNAVAELLAKNAPGDTHHSLVDGFRIYSEKRKFAWFSQPGENIWGEDKKLCATLAQAAKAYAVDDLQQANVAFFTNAETLTARETGHLRFAVCLEPLSDAQRTTLSEKAGHPVYSVWGEDNEFFAAQLPDGIDGNIRQIGSKPGSVGRPLPHVAIRAVDADGNPLMPGEVGQLQVFPARATDWKTTTRHGHLDEDGFVYLQE